MNEMTLLTTEELSLRIRYEPRTIRTKLKDSVLLEGVHYIRPFGGRKLLFIWETIEADLKKIMLPGMVIPLAKGGVCNG